MTSVGHINPEHVPQPGDVVRHGDRSYVVATVERVGPDRYHATVRPVARPLAEAVAAGRARRVRDDLLVTTEVRARA